VAERRRGRWAAARGALEVALEMAPGAAVSHVEMAEVLLELDDAATALEHAEKAATLEGESPRVTAVRQRVKQKAGAAAKGGEPGWGAKVIALLKRGKKP